MTPPPPLTGRCLCGAVRYDVSGPLQDVVNCHCHRCRRHTGHFMAAAEADSADVRVHGEALAWYDATKTVQYGFCGSCGSSLFWRTSEQPDKLSIAAGTLDPPTGLTTRTAIFTSDASDYHSLDGTLDEFPKDR